MRKFKVTDRKFHLIIDSWSFHPNVLTPLQTTFFTNLFNLPELISHLHLYNGDQIFHPRRAPHDKLLRRKSPFVKLHRGKICFGKFPRGKLPLTHFSRIFPFSRRKLPCIHLSHFFTKSRFYWS